MPTINELLDHIDLTNNGYIFAPTEAELQCARNNLDVVKIRGKQISRIETKIERFKYVPQNKKPVTASYDMPDYEGAILARQERTEFY